MANRFDIGDKPVVTTTFTVNGVAASPSALIGFYEKPDGTEVAVTPVVVTPGVFTMTLPRLDVAGRWYWRIAGTVGVIAADEGQFIVVPSQFASP